MVKSIFIFHFFLLYLQLSEKEQKNTGSELKRREYTVFASNMHFQKLLGLNCLQKSSIVDVRLGSKYVSDFRVSS